MAEKTLEAYNDVFADIVNGLLFKGRQVISEEELVDAQPFSMYKADGRGRSQERDVAKFWQKGRIRLSFLGLENQTSPDADMPLRVMGYDGAAYRAQLADDGHEDLYPVVTLVLYFGTEHRWICPRTLKGRLKDIPPELAPFVNDYKAYIFELAWLEDKDVEAFKGDFHDVVEFLRCQRKHILYQGTDRQIRHVHEVLELLRVISADERIRDVEIDILESCGEKGGTTMYNMITAMIDKGQERGIAIGQERGIAIGQERGIAIGQDKTRRSTARRMLELGKFSIKEIADISGLSEDEVKNLSL